MWLRLSTSDILIDIKVPQGAENFVPISAAVNFPRMGQIFGRNVSVDNHPLLLLAFPDCEFGKTFV